VIFGHFPPRNSNQWLLLNECQVDVDNLKEKHMNNVNQQKTKMNGTSSWEKSVPKTIETNSEHRIYMR